ncbi:uncharacterized protein DFL_000498 [Arthrobotrys flagrans]|uniref:Uncharacterized protein n=1 Tax=Arthrobotrys flagrans TaxID=97331 RepID=A0A437ADZ0_ARTFL|nr:hypothetical protein DFL_000498 [Arthrobotrys flagrans]
MCCGLIDLILSRLAKAVNNGLLAIESTSVSPSIKYRVAVVASKVSRRHSFDQVVKIYSQRGCQRTVTALSRSSHESSNFNSSPPGYLNKGYRYKISEIFQVHNYNFRRREIKIDLPNLFLR